MVLEINWKQHPLEEEVAEEAILQGSTIRFPEIPPPGKEQFMSWVSIALLVVLVIFFRSSATAFINPLVSSTKPLLPLLVPCTYMRVALCFRVWSGQRHLLTPM